MAKGGTNWLKLTQEAFDASSSFIETNHQADWDYSLRAFRNEHAASSKYLSDEYRARSRLYRPKTRSVIRKNEAAAAAALFSNMEIVDISAGDPDNPMSLAARDAMKALLEYRLGTTLPTFQICMGGVQDAQTVGVVCSYQYWDYEQRNGRTVKDKPCIELRPIENIRLDGGASWLDPVGTSPYFCDIVPMYVCDVRGMMGRDDPKTGQPVWKKLKDSDIEKARPDQVHSIRQSRLGKQQDPHQETTGIKEFDVVWVMRWFMKDSQGYDKTYYTLGTEAMLTDPKPLEEVYFHGIRPYQMGYAILETHKTFKTGVPMIAKPLQQESNDVANMRIDNVKLVLNKRYYVARGRQTDLNSLVRNVSGGVTLTNDPKTDIIEASWPDVTSSSYVEQDRLNADFDDLVGNFTPSTKVANNAVNDTLGGSKMAAQSAGMMTDYLLRTIIETWWEGVLRQLLKLEAAYETDEKILYLAAKKARLFPKYGVSQINDSLLNEDVLLTVNVGMGASDPAQRMQKFLMATQAAIGIATSAPAGFNVSEAIKEIYSNAGYRDGTRFFSGEQDPRLLKAMQMVQQLQKMLEEKVVEQRGKLAAEQAKIESNEKIKFAELEVDQRRIEGDLAIRHGELMIEQARVLLEKMIAELEANEGKEERLAALMEMANELKLATLKLQEQKIKNQGAALKLIQQREKPDESKKAA